MAKTHPPAPIETFAPPADVLGQVVALQQARRAPRRKAVEDTCRLLCDCASLPHELPPLLQAAVEDALTTLRHLLLPAPEIPKGRRGRRPDFESPEAFWAALDAGLTRFPRRKTFTKANFASHVRTQTPDGHEHSLSERALTYYLELYRVDWKALKGRYKGTRKNGKNSRR